MRRRRSQKVARRYTSGYLLAAPAAQTMDVPAAQTIDFSNSF
ncbi:MAG TPA: hypothetical protein VGC66_12660 [Pyrinomonadaceae bacterium]